MPTMRGYSVLLARKVLDLVAGQTANSEIMPTELMVFARNCAPQLGRVVDEAGRVAEFDAAGDADLIPAVAAVHRGSCAGHCKGVQ